MTPVLAVVAAIFALSPVSLQARYDRARDIVESTSSASERARVQRTIAALEQEDHRPKGTAPSIPLPSTAGLARPEGTRDAKLAAKLSAIGQRYRGSAGFWVHDLATGSTAGWNSDARFPAASTVKLGVLAAALRRYGPRPERSHVAYDLRQLTGWSSNLAANRLYALLGHATVQRGLASLGMWSSTYTGPYRAGTSRTLDAPRQPRLSTGRVTTAHDLGRALFALQARRAGLTRHEAEYGLTLLRHSIPVGDNQGLLRPWLHGVAVAEKNGWLSDTRITAAIVYRASGPLIIVVEVNRPNLPRYEARAIGREVLRAAGL
jgi:beta-lactamase class A